MVLDGDKHGKHDNDLSRAIRDLQRTNSELLDRITGAYSGISVPSAGDVDNVDMMLTREAMGDEDYDAMIRITDEMMGSMGVAAGSGDDGDVDAHAGSGRAIGFPEYFDDDDDDDGIDVDELLDAHVHGSLPRRAPGTRNTAGGSTTMNGSKPIGDLFMGNTMNRSSNPNAPVHGAGSTAATNGGTGNQAVSVNGVQTSTNDHAEPPVVNDDDPEVRKRREALLVEAHEELDGLVGLENVKRSIGLWESTIRADKERARLGLVPEGRDNTMSYHVVFTGDPGTGKTSVARIYGKILTGLGVLNGMSGEIIETDRSGMVAGYAGQTAIMVNARCNEAIEHGCPLFIDEVYQLKNGRDDAYGDEAIATLLRRMENDRDDLVVIVAGYRHETEAFLNTNPGLRSRFSAKLEFKNYTNDELLLITEGFARGRSIILTDDVRKALSEAFDEMRGTDAFANARTARTIFDNAVQAQSARFTQRVSDPDAEPLTDDEARELLTTLTTDDVVNAKNEALNIARRDTTSRPAYQTGERTNPLTSLLTDLLTTGDTPDIDNTADTGNMVSTDNNATTADSVDSVDDADTVDSVDTVDTVDGVNSVDDVDTVDDADTVDTVDDADSVDDDSEE